ISRPGATASCVCRRRAASSSRGHLPARPMRATAPRSKPGSPSSTASRPRIRAPFRLRREWRPTPQNCSTAFAVWFRRASPAAPHPTRLVQSVAMAAVAPPRPSYRPHLPPRLLSAAILSDAQLESVVYAGEAHTGPLAGSYTVNETYDIVTAAPADATDAVRF